MNVYNKEEGLVGENLHPNSDVDIESFVRK